jgi:S1-C subfamily serine protease
MMNFEPGVPIPRRHILRSIAGLTVSALPALAHAADEPPDVHDSVARRMPAEVGEREVSKPPLASRGGPNAASILYRRCVGSVVLVGTENGIGSGVLVSERGDIVTNEHVVRDAYREGGVEWVGIWFKPVNSSRVDKDSLLLASVIRRLEIRDLALVRLVRPLPAGTLVVSISTSQPEIGQDVFVIGHPRGYLWSLTQGIVSQIRHGYQWRYSDSVARTATAIQTQAPINPGNSGGPLLDQAGNIIGLVAAGATDAQGIFFAIAAEHVAELMRS